SQTNFPNPGLQTQVFPAYRRHGRFVRITATELWKKDEDEFVFALAETEIFSKGRNLAREAAVSASDSVEKERWGKRFLADGFSSITHLHEPLHPYGYQSAPARKPNATKWVDIDLGRTVPVDVVRLFPESSRGRRGKEADGETREIHLLTSAAIDHPGQGPPFETLTNITWRGAIPL